MSNTAKQNYVFDSSENATPFIAAVNAIKDANNPTGYAGNATATQSGSDIVVDFAFTAGADCLAFAEAAITAFVATTGHVSIGGVTERAI